MTSRASLQMAAAATIVAIGVATLLSRSDPAQAESGVPAAAIVEPNPKARDVAVLAGGCFWGVEAVFEHVKGVIDVRSGYAGGDKNSANYSSVSSGRTRHAEAVRIVFDPRLVRYSDLLRIYFAVAHDPTEVNRQGPDVGPQYRSAIFPQSPDQARVARAYINQLQKARVFARPVATKIEQGRFVDAEPYHQNFMARNPAHPYIVIHDKPKLAALKRQFPKSFKG